MADNYLYYGDNLDILKRYTIGLMRVGTCGSR